MRVLKRIVGLFMLMLLVTGMVYQPAQGHRAQPQQLYHEAWELVKHNYFDASFNGVNWKELEHKYDSRINTVEDAHKYIKVMLKTLNDPYTRFLDPVAFKDENDAIDAKIVGIGINLVSKDKKLKITKTIEDGPAEKAGVKPGDEIVMIDHQSSVGITPEQAADRIRGKIGEPVHLALRRPEGVKHVTIVRDEVIIHAISARMQPNNIGYIQIHTFISNDAAREFKAALLKLNRADGLVIDLRENPGGLLSNALDIADMLLESGPIVSTISRRGRHTDIASGAPLTHQPIVVLVDEDSASASEILAGALQDNNRAVLVGTKTYGKGLVQEINKLGDAAVHITVSRYLTPSGADINKIGVKPNITVAKKDEQLPSALSYLKEKIASSKRPLRTSSLVISH